MHALVNPYETQRRLRWRNRLDDWRAAPAGPLFHLGAALAVLVLVGLLIGEALLPHAGTLIALWQRHPTTVAGAFALLAFLDSRRRLAARRRQWQRGWLAAQPIAPRWQRQALAAWLRRRVVVAALLVTGAAGLLHRGSPMPLWLPLTVVAALALGAAAAWLGDRARGPQPVAIAVSTATDTISGHGRLWRWQLVAMFGARRGAALAPGIWLLLLLPMGSYDLRVLLAIVLSALLLAAFAAAWRLALQTIIDAAAWLTPQPWPPAAWLRAALPLPLATLALLLMLLAPALWRLGSVPAAVSIATLAAVALLHLLLTLAERHRPRRIGPLLLLQLGLLGGLAASLPLLLPPLLVGQIVWLLRRIHRNPP